MKLAKAPLLVILFAVCLSACAPSTVPFTNFTVFTEDLRGTLESAGIPLAKVQFYNDKPITIKRQGTNANDISVDAEGQISIQNGKTVQTINVRPFTPGVVMSSTAGSINVSFDDTQKDKQGMHFILQGNQYYIETMDGNKFSYNGNVFDIPAGTGSRLFVSKDLLNQVNRQNETQKGRRVGGGQ
ncbi:hypothetical protein [Persicitalea jodogahamensis]|uniref:Uncharacterized protein n=1 Tax=Persicitalea jodogahamensis TaxID=402147 RepID=A0A8J3D5I5_9BACT|nr:hypothetical protein [Persicitalea jodogahamensis]GHB77418.1 hypothetical protein GCM10007390_34400 [Persicitalea jodogahamensis]